MVSLRWISALWLTDYYERVSGNLDLYQGLATAVFIEGKYIGVFNRLDAYWHFETKNSGSVDVNSSRAISFSGNRRFLLLV